MCCSYNVLNVQLGLQAPWHNIRADVLIIELPGSGLAVTAVVASVFSALEAVVSSKWGGKINSRNTSYFAGAQSLGGVLMLLFFSVVILVTLHY